MLNKKFFSIFFCILINCAYCIDWTILASNYDPDSDTWSSTTTLSDSSYMCQNPLIVMNSSGSAMVAWNSSETLMQIRASNYDSSSWQNTGSSAFNVSDESTYGAASHTLDMNASNQAIIGWLHYDGSNSRVNASHYNGTSWTKASSLLSESGRGASYPQLSMNSSNNAFCVWTRSNGSNNIVQASYFNGSSWTNPSSVTNISQSGYTSYAPQIQINNSNYAILAWLKPNDSAVLTVQAAHYNGSSWSHTGSNAFNLSEDYNANVLKLTTNSLGNGYASWNSSATPSVIQSRYYNVYSDSWASTNTLSSTYNASNDAISMNNSNFAIAVWERSDGTNDRIQESESDGPAPPI